ncbi:MAG: CDP-alcohol phosphatidyltransferase family protein [Aquificota bacterium]|nr:CDP-alcohol phosphatidyltransferase family protein [Aquificota bacterium]
MRDIPSKVPNALSLLRILLSPAVPFLAGEGKVALSWVLFSLLALSDALDGFLARVLKAETFTGKILDPLADKVLLLSGLITVTYILPSGIDPVLFKLLLTRDLFLITGSLVLLRLGFVPAPSLSGKATTASVAFTVFTAYMSNTGWFGVPGAFLTTAYSLSLLLILLSWGDYTLRGLRFLTVKLIMERR